MKSSFETKLTIRLYDTDFVNRLEDVFQASGERYESKNHFLTELLRIGLAEKLKADAAKRTDSPKSDECTGLLGQIRTMIEDMHVCNKAQVEQLMAHLQISEKLSSAIYNMLVAITEDDRISVKQVEDGFYDDLPERLVRELQYLIDRLAENLPG